MWETALAIACHLDGKSHLRLHSVRQGNAQDPTRQILGRREFAQQVARILAAPASIPMADAKFRAASMKHAFPGPGERN
jgi:hypothetical protein